MRDTDESLLRSFAIHRDEEAFRTLADRYLGLVFHTALRRTNNRPLAEEVSQNILCALANKASSLARNPDLLPAWLHRATLFESSKAMRSESSHQRRKQLQQPDEIASADSPWSDAIPHLDLALDKLSESDRGILLLHFFENRPFPKIAQALGKNPAAVQKQSQRALAKLARILRGRGVTLTATAIAAGLTTELAKAAPVALLQSAATAVLTGSATYSTTGLTLMFATKSKVLIPLVLLLLLAPLIFQQVAISRALNRNENLRIQLATTAPPTERNGSFRQYPVAIRSTPSGRITINTLSRALDQAKRGGPLAWIASDQLVELIPRAVALSESWNKRTELLAYLIHALAKVDSELAVRTVVAADPRGRMIGSGSGLDAAFAAWADKDLDSALAYFQKIESDREINSMSEGAVAWGTSLNNLHAALLGSMVAAKSPRIREVLLMAPNATRPMALKNAMDRPSLGLGMTHESPSYNLNRNLLNFIPLIREFIPEKERTETLQRLLIDLRQPGRSYASELGEVMDQVDLLPSEKRTISQSYALEEISTLFNTTPPPDREDVETRTRQWLEQHVPDQAGEIFNEAKATAYRHEQFQTKSRIESMARDLEITDAWLIQQLTSNRFGEMLPQALEQSQRIKDPDKRAEVIRHLQKP